MTRSASIDRSTSETQIHLEWVLDGSGRTKISTGVGFLDHMLDLFGKHGAFDLTVQAEGDRHIDDHHTVEDVGICMGQALFQALGDKKGINRYGHMTLPMDEVLVTAAVDLSGRAAFVWNVEMPTEKIGTFDTQLLEEFWSAFTNNARMNYHTLLHYGRNSHHIAEAVFKCSARAIRMAVAEDTRLRGQIPSTKGSL